PSITDRPAAPGRGPPAHHGRPACLDLCISQRHAGWGFDDDRVDTRATVWPAKQLVRNLESQGPLTRLDTRRGDGHVARGRLGKRERARGGRDNGDCVLCAYAYQQVVPSEPEVPGDHHSLHLVRALPDLQDLLVAVEPGDRELVHVAVT